MEDETQTSTVEVPVKVADGVKSDADSIAPPVKVEGDQDVTVTNGELHQEEETALDGEFIKVEKESLEGKDSSHMDKAIAEGEKEFTSLDSSSNSLVNTGILEAQEKVKTLELELERLAKALQDSESEKARLKDEAHIAEEKLDERDKQCEELEINQKRLHEKFTEAEDRYASQLKTLQETVGAHESKEKELIEVKEAFHGISTELDSSRKKMQELDQELISSAEKAHKYEELHKQSGSHAESETQKALEFERMLELAKLSAKEMEDQMASLQEEVKGLYEKILENQKVEEVLKSTSVQLSEAQAEQELFKLQVTELEQKLASGEAVIKELSQDLDLHKASESQMKEDIQALENLFSVAKEDLQLKIASLEENELKLLEEIKTREKVEHSLKIQEEKIFSMQEELMKVSGEKAALEVAAAEINGNVLKMKDLCGDLEARLKVSDENFCKADGLHSQALSQNIELEEKLKSLEELHQESGSVAATTTQRNLELEDIIRASSAAEEEAKSQLREIEMRLISAEEKNLELEQQINLAELRNVDADKELKGFSEKTAELTAILRGNEEESAKLKTQLQEYEEKVVQLESALSQSSLKHSELEQELKDLVQKSADHEGQVHSTRQRSLELEDMIQLSNSKAEGAGKKVGEMELLLETANYRIQELEEQIKISETKCANTEVESKQYSDKLTEVGEELEAFQVKASSLEIALQSSLEKEQQLMESLNVITEEKKTLEEAAQIAKEKVSEFQNLMEILQNELKLTQDKLVNIEKDLNSSSVRENEIMEKLKSAEEQLEQQGKVIEQATAKNTELELLHESLVKDSDLKLQEAMVSFTSRDSEAKDLYQKVTSLEDQLVISKQQEIETAEREASLKAQLEESLTKVATLETTIGELQSKVSEAETTAGQSLSECELLVETNLKLKQELESHQIKVNELQELLNGFHAEKENTRELLGSHVKTITELTDQNSRALELQSVTEFQIKEAEIQLHQAIEKFTLRDSEAKELNEKLSSLEVQVKTYEEQVLESATLADSKKLELEEALLKLKNAEGILEQLQTKADRFGTENESLAEVNLKLTQELAAYETKISELQTTLNKILVEKEETVEQLHSSTKTIEDLTQQLAAEEQRLQSQISSLMEENNLLTKTYQDAKEEFHILIAETEAQLNEQKTKEEVLSAEVKNLKTGMAEKSVMQTRVAELEQQLILADTRLKEEVESIKAVSAEKEAGITSKLEDHARKLAERDLVDEQLGQLQKELSLAHTTIAEKKEAETALKHSLEEVKAKHQQAILLEKQVEELEQKLQLAESKYKQKEVEEGNKLALVNEEMNELKKKLSEQTELEKKIEALENQLKLAKTKPEEQIKSVQSEVKDAIEVKSRDLGSSISTPKRRSKKRSEATQSSEVSPTISTQTTNSSSAMSFKFIIGVALVSVIIGVILGKRY